MLTVEYVPGSRTEPRRTVRTVYRVQLVAGIKKTHGTRSVPDFLRFPGLFHNPVPLFLTNFLTRLTLGGTGFSYEHRRIAAVCCTRAAPPHTSHPTQLIAAQSESEESDMRPLTKTSSSALGRSIHVGGLPSCTRPKRFPPVRVLQGTFLIGVFFLF